MMETLGTISGVGGLNLGETGRRKTIAERLLLGGAARPRPSSTSTPIPGRRRRERPASRLPATAGTAILTMILLPGRRG
jgi:hypothetical protein